MPVYQQSYREYEGQYLHRFRWWIVLEQELRVLAKSKLFLGLILLAFIHFLIRVLQVVAYDIIVQDPDHPLTPVLSRVTFLIVNEQMILDFFRIQTPLIFFLGLYVGSGLICNDFRNNLVEIYFSKPLTWLDYTIGKVLALITVLLSVSALPALLLVLLHNIFRFDLKVLQDTWWWMPAIVALALLLVVPMALGILASSAVSQTSRFAAISIFMITVTVTGIGVLLSELIRDRGYLIISVPHSLEWLGQWLFRQPRPIFNTEPSYPILYVSSICLGAFAIILRRVRRAEVAR